jgi:chlorophyllase
MVAFLEKWVEGRPEWLDGIRERPEVAPVVLSAVEFRDAGTRIHGVMLPA